MMTKPDSPVVREPKQQRSRLSFERIQDAALALLVERGSDAFTLAEVCARADASMGAIYNRVDGKDDLIRVIHDREMARMDHDTVQALEGKDLSSGHLGEAAAKLIDGVEVVLQRHADVLRPFMLLAAKHEQISIRGRMSHQIMTDQFIELLSQRRGEIRHPNPVAAIKWCFTIVYSVFARRLGLGFLEGAEEVGGRDEVIAELADTVTAYLLMVR